MHKIFLVFYSLLYNIPPIFVKIFIDFIIFLLIGHLFYIFLCILAIPINTVVIFDR